MIHMLSYSAGRLAGPGLSVVPALGILAVLATWSASAEACPTDPYLGSVCTTAANFCPRGYEEMAGQVHSIAENQALYSLLGCKWGGDCRSSFAYPNMRGRAAVGAGQGPGLSLLELGQWRGQQEVVIGAHQMPTHNHAATATVTANVEVAMSDAPGASPTPSRINDTLGTVSENPFAANSKANIYGPAAGTSIPMGGVDAAIQVSAALGDTGEGDYVDIQNPVMAVTYCIATEGLYPHRP